mgnify:CR=1 FL=1
MPLNYFSDPEGVKGITVRLRACLKTDESVSLQIKDGRLITGQLYGDERGKAHACLSGNPPA